MFQAKFCLDPQNVYSVVWRYLGEFRMINRFRLYVIFLGLSLSACNNIESGLRQPEQASKEDPIKLDSTKADPTRNTTKSGLRQTEQPSKEEPIKPNSTRADPAKNIAKDNNMIDFSNIKSKEHLKKMLGNTIWYRDNPGDWDIVTVYLFSPKGDSIDWRADPKNKRSLDQAINTSVGLLGTFTPDYNIVEDKGVYSMYHEKYGNKEIFTFASENGINIIRLHQSWPGHDAKFELKFYQRK